MTAGEEKDIELFESDNEAFKRDRLNISAVKYFWQASPLAKSRIKTIPKFLRRVDIFEDLSEIELRIISKFLHPRAYTDNEPVIREGKNGFGFYLIYDGKAEIFTRQTVTKDGQSESFQQYVTELSTYEYFGELALLEKNDKRNATIIAKGTTSMLAMYKPDLDELISRYPVIGAKVLQSLSLIIARRLVRVAEELKNFKKKVVDLECCLESENRN